MTYLLSIMVTVLSPHCGEKRLDDNGSSCMLQLYAVSTDDANAGEENGDICSI